MYGYIRTCTDFLSSYGFVYRFFLKYGFFLATIRIFKIFWEFNSISTRNSSEVPIISKNALNKSCPKLNFYKKLTGCISLSRPEVVLRGFKHFPFLNDATEWKSRFTLERNVSKSTDYIEKYFNQMSIKIKFPTKTLLGGANVNPSQ